MSYLHCGRCGLQIRIQASFMRIEHCPRCLARSSTLSPLVESVDWVSPEVGWAPVTADRPEDPRARRT
jgi:hypothetical protein